MKKHTLRLPLSPLVIFASFFFFVAPSKSAPRPLSKSELLALVSGGVQPENIVHEISSHGLNFISDETYLSLVQISETIFPADDIRITMSVSGLCNVYTRWGKPDKAEPCYRRLIPMLEKHSAANNPALIFAITAEIKALRDLGRTDEANKLQERLGSLSASHANPN